MAIASKSRILAALCLIAFSTAQTVAASTTAGDLPARTGEDGGGIDYYFQMYLDASGGTVAESWSDSVGSKAWSDPSNLAGSLGIPLGWTHTSAWGYISLSSAANVTLSLAASDGSSDLVPAFTLWRGSDNSGGNSHTYQQDAVPRWVDEPDFSFIGYVTTGPGPYSGEKALMNLVLEAGEYTVAIGGNDNTTNGHQAAYRFSATASPVPLPGAFYLFGSALCMALGNRCRKKAD